MIFFQPSTDKLYLIKYTDDAGHTYYFMNSQDKGFSWFQNNNLDETAIQNNDSHLMYKWQFFEVSKNNYILTNYGTGALATSLIAGGPTIYVVSQKASFDNDTLQVRLIGDINTSVYIFGYNATYSGYFSNDDDGSNPYAYMLDSTDNINPFELVEIGDFNIPENNLEAPNQLPPTPSIINGICPLYFPSKFETNIVLSEAYVPYFMVNDKLMPSFADRIQQTPYYILKEYGRYELAANVRNSTTGVHTFVEHWQHGWTTSDAIAFNASMGFSLGVDVEENEIVLKEQEEATMTAQFGVTDTATVGRSEYESQEVRMEVPANTIMALYGISTMYELFHMDGTATGNSSNGLKKHTNFLMISEPDEPS